MDIKEKLRQADGKFKTMKLSKQVALVGGSIILIVALAWSVNWLIYRLTHATTNDSFVEADLINLSPLVPGYVAKLYFDEFDKFEKGDLLAELDPRDYIAAYGKAKAAFDDAEKNYIRYKNLYETRSVSKKTFDAYEAGYLETKSALEKAELNIEYSKIIAPFDGVIAKRYIKTGDYSAPGLPVFCVYDPNTIYVLANLEETKLHGVKEGNDVDIWVDASHGKKIKGKVWQMGTAAAAKFALIPRDVTAGEFTKVEQRLPIKISVNDPGEYWFLRPGLASEVGIERTKN